MVFAFIATQTALETSGMNVVAEHPCRPADTDTQWKSGGFSIYFHTNTHAGQPTQTHNGNPGVFGVK